MRIGINARYLQKETSGIINYLLNLILNLKKIDKESKYTLFFGNDKPIPAEVLGDNFRSDIPRMPTNSQIMRVLWEHLYLPLTIKKLKIDIFHEPSFIAPVFKKCPTVITIYDLAFLYYPECFTRRNVMYFKAMLTGSINKADAIIAISENTKRDIINHFKVHPDKIKVIYGGVDSFFRIVSDAEKISHIKKKFNINRSYILNVSLISPRKNLISLLKSFKRLKEDKNIDCQLVIAGEKGWRYKDIFKTVSSLNLDDSTVFTGCVSNEELLHLYNNAMLFAYPSLYEGFGLPVLEAMACGCPVVASNTSSIPEVCADAAMLVDPENIDDLTGAIYKMITEDSVKQVYKKKGLERIKCFLWKETAQETLYVYKKII
ncbi:MAG: glycosyltransferase family 4 protein [Elusimicrobia bacterium]|nr:glycosyltransferase family 4 protein [Elusimicrobiota bacterium]